MRKALVWGLICALAWSQVALAGVNNPVYTHATTRTVLTAGAGNYTPTAGVRYINVRMCGGGGGAGTFPGTSGVNGAATTFGTLTANGGSLGSAALDNYANGGTATGGDYNLTGQTGGTGSASGTTIIGGPGGSSAFFGGGAPGVLSGGSTKSGLNATGNGSGGSGNVVNGTNAGSGGAAAGCLEKLISPIAAPYAYSVGAAGAGGTGGSGGTVGGAGSPGIIIIEEFYN